MDERVERAKAKEFHKLGFKTRVGLEDWQRRNVPKGTGKCEESKKGNSRKKRKKNSYNNVIPEELWRKQPKNTSKKKPR